MKLQPVGTRVHPCAPWTEVPDSVAARLFSGGRGAAEDVLVARQDRLLPWKPSAAFPQLVERVRREQGPGPAAMLSGVGAGDPVVLTGQQPSFAGGPLFVWLKAWTAVAQAERASHLLGRPVRALFWIAGDDSDLLEMRGLSDPLLRRVFDSHGPGAGETRVPAGPLPIPPGRRAALAAEIASVWTDSVLPALVGESPDLSTLMLSCLRRWFGDRLLVVDAAWSETRRCAGDVYRVFAREPAGIHGELSAGIATARAAGLPVSIRSWPDRLRLFRVSERGRLRVFHDGSAWTDGAERWTDSDLQDALGRDPAGFSHDVVSRPFAAEAAFPVLAHVLGPGEFAYFATLGPLSSRLGALAPVLPRASATLLPEGPWPLAREAGWDPVRDRAPAFGALSHALLAARTPGEGLWPKLWSDARADYLGILGEGAIEDGALAALSRRLDAFEARWRRSRIRSVATAHRDDLESLRRLALIAGEGGLQERLWSPWALEHHLGDPSLLHRLESALDPMQTAHAVWEVA